MLFVVPAPGFVQLTGLHSFNSLILIFFMVLGVLKDPLSYCLMFSPHYTAFYAPVIEISVIISCLCSSMLHHYTRSNISVLRKWLVTPDCKNYEFSTKLFKYKSGCRHLNLRKFVFLWRNVKAKLQADQDKPSQTKSDRCQSQGHAKVVSKTACS